MKSWFGILFLFLLTVLFATVPTSYASACSGEKEKKESTEQYAQRTKKHEATFHHSATEDSQNNHSCPIGGCQDDCNCGCSCVHSQTSIFTGFAIKVLLSNLLLEQDLPELKRNLALQSYHTDIWQPPKC